MKALYYVHSTAKTLATLRLARLAPPKFTLRNQYCYAAVWDANVPDGHWFKPRPLHSPSSSLLICLGKYWKMA